MNFTHMCSQPFVNRSHKFAMSAFESGIFHVLDFDVSFQSIFAQIGFEITHVTFVFVDVHMSSFYREKRKDV